MAILKPLLIEAYIDTTICDQIIAVFRSSNSRARSYQGIVDERVRNCSFVRLSENYDHVFQHFVKNQMEPYYGQSIDQEIYDRPLIYRYPRGVGFVPHHDLVTQVEAERGRHNEQPVVAGDYSLVAFINAPEEYGGGELYFPDHGWRFKPSKGSIVVYPTDERYVHGVSAIESGERFSVVCRIFNVASQGKQAVWLKG